jgi:hypothetical protein
MSGSDILKGKEKERILGMRDQGEEEKGKGRARKGRRADKNIQGALSISLFSSFMLPLGLGFFFVLLFIA